MKTLLLLFTGTIFLTNFSFSQESEVEEKLRILYADEKYQDCAAKAIKYSEKKHKSDPIVYIYASKACLRMSQDHDLSQKFPKAFKDALSFATKYRKKDKNGDIYDQYIEHFEEMKRIVAEEIDNFLLEDRKEKIYKASKKSAGLLKKINKMDPDDKGALLLRAVLEMKAQNTAEGRSLIKQYLPQIKKIKATKAEMPTPKEPVAPVVKEKKKKAKNPIKVKPLKSFEEMSEMEQIHLKMGLMGYSNHLYIKNKPEEAKKIIELGKSFFYKENDLFKGKYDSKFKALYNKING